MRYKIKFVPSKEYQYDQIIPNSQYLYTHLYSITIPEPTFQQLYYENLYHRNTIFFNRKFQNSNDIQFGIRKTDNVAHFRNGIFPIMYAMLPQTKKINSFDNIKDDLPLEIYNYLLQLKKYCLAEDVLFYYDKKENSFLICIIPNNSELKRIMNKQQESEDWENNFLALHKLLLDRVRGFNLTTDFVPFIETYYYSLDKKQLVGEFKGITCILPTNNYNSIIENSLKSYFYNSVFCDAIKGPVGVSIAPYNKQYTHQFRHNDKIGNLCLTKTELLQENGLSIQGEFCAIDEKGLGCTVTDAENFTSDLSFSEDRVSITTTINAARKVEEKDFDGQTIRGAFFTCLDGNGNEGTIVYTEHFVKIANGKRLLHYSNEFDSFEVFDLPNNWFVENGISFETVGYPKVFNNTMYDDEDEDLDEIREVMKLTRGQQLTKKQEQPNA